MKYLDENGLLYLVQKIKTWLADKANASDLTSHTGNTTVHITSAERTKWNAAKTHADSAHAPSNAEANQNAFSNVKVGSTTIEADSKTDTLELAAGNNVTLTPDASGDKVTITAKDTTYSTATQSANGLMSSTDKKKLDGIATGAEVNVQSDWSATDTASDAYIKNKPTIPTNNNQLTNGAGYQTASQVNTAIANAVKDITSFEYEVVTALPTTGVKGKIYLVAHAHGTGDAYDEYIWTGSAFEKIGNTDVDLSEYKKKSVLFLPEDTGINVSEVILNFKTGKVMYYAYGSRSVPLPLIDSDVYEKKLIFSGVINGIYEDVIYDSTTSSWVGNHIPLVPATRKVNGNALSADITLAAADVGAVPTSRKVNGKALSADITLAAADVSAVPTTRKVNGKALSADITLSASDVSAVPTSRTVNGKALSANISLTAEDIGCTAITNAEIDTICAS